MVKIKEIKGKKKEKIKVIESDLEEMHGEIVLHDEREFDDSVRSETPIVLGSGGSGFAKTSQTVADASSVRENEREETDNIRRFYSSGSEKEEEKDYMKMRAEAEMIPLGAQERINIRDKPVLQSPETLAMREESHRVGKYYEFKKEVPSEGERRKRAWEGRS